MGGPQLTAYLGGELLKLGIDVGQTSVAKYMAKPRRPSSQGWKTFLRNHAYASMDLLVVPTVSFRLLYALPILRHGRRELLYLGVIAHPNAEWIARQLTEAYGWREVRHYLVRDPTASMVKPSSVVCTHGYPRPPDRGTLPMAERICR